MVIPPQMPSQVQETFEQALEDSQHAADVYEHHLHAQSWQYQSAIDAFNVLMDNFDPSGYHLHGMPSERG